MEKEYSEKKPVRGMSMGISLNIVVDKVRRTLVWPNGLCATRYSGLMQFFFFNLLYIIIIIIIVGIFIYLNLFFKYAQCVLFHSVKCFVFLILCSVFSLRNVVSMPVVKQISLAY